ncbi:hypothetical protein [Burkholderia pseudomallei]|uniref:hypothetical protein n=1 Tax=Burkholderia pseudomallei TaxID=28450 RepID=UPI0015E0F34E|nr:hypothetical protein [Burkholderia pseudomallei]
MAHGYPCGEVTRTVLNLATAYRKVKITVTPARAIAPAVPAIGAPPRTARARLRNRPAARAAAAAALAARSNPRGERAFGRVDAAKDGHENHARGDNRIGIDTRNMPIAMDDSNGRHNVGETNGARMAAHEKMRCLTPTIFFRRADTAPHDARATRRREGTRIRAGRRRARACGRTWIAPMRNL